jgi:hypothetical protein
LKPTHIFNCHVKDAFTFTPKEIAFMRANLDNRERLFGELVPWDHANYGMDASWIRCDPYTQKAAPDAALQLDIVITNHSTEPRPASCRAVLPKTLGKRRTAWVEATAAAKAELRIPLKLRIPAEAAAGRYVAAIDVKFGPWRLPQIAEAIIDI